MKNILTGVFALFLLVLFSGSLSANSSSRSDGAGGYNHSDGSSSRSDGAGGYNHSW